jgi:hypothetical protein
MTLENQLKIIYELRPFQKNLTCPVQITGTLVVIEKVFFLGERLGLGQIAGILDHESQITDRTICV